MINYTNTTPSAVEQHLDAALRTWNATGIKAMRDALAAIYFWCLEARKKDSKYKSSLEKYINKQRKDGPAFFYDEVPANLTFYHLLEVTLFHGKKDDSRKASSSQWNKVLTLAHEDKTKPEKLADWIEKQGGMMNILGLRTKGGSKGSSPKANVATFDNIKPLYEALNLSRALFPKKKTVCQIEQTDNATTILAYLDADEPLDVLRIELKDKLDLETDTYELKSEDVDALVSPDIASLRWQIEGEQLVLKGLAIDLKKMEAREFKELTSPKTHESKALAKKFDKLAETFGLAGIERSKASCSAKSKLGTVTVSLVQ